MNRLLFLLLIYASMGMAQSRNSLVNVTVAKSIAYVSINNVVSIWVDVKMGYHIQGNKVEDESLIPTTLEVTTVEGITIVKQEFPSAKEFRLEGTDSSLKVYDGQFQIKLFLNPHVKMQTGNYLLSATLNYQACDSKSCLFPRSIDFSIPIEIKRKKIIHRDTKTTNQK